MRFLPCLYVLCLTLLWTGCQTSHPISDDAAPVLDAPADVAIGVDSGAPDDDAGAITDAPERADARGDAGPAPAAGRVTCGMSECDLATHGCLASCLYATDERLPACIATTPDGAWPADECPTGREMFPRFWLRCDGTEDCAAGEWCHVVFGSTGQFAYCAACTEPCDYASFQPLCHGDSDCPAEAPSCLPTMALPGYTTCQR